MQIRHASRGDEADLAVRLTMNGRKGLNPDGGQHEKKVYLGMDT